MVYDGRHIVEEIELLEPANIRIGDRFLYRVPVKEVQKRFSRYIIRNSRSVGSPDLDCAAGKPLELVFGIHLYFSPPWGFEARRSLPSRLRWHHNTVRMFEDYQVIRAASTIPGMSDNFLPRCLFRRLDHGIEPKGHEPLESGRDSVRLGARTIERL